MREDHWHVVGVSRVGFSHVDGDIPCQDAYAVETSGEWLVAAVCDGAGSASHSKVGADELSAHVVKSIVSRLKRRRKRDGHPPPEQLRTWVEEAIGETRESVVEAVPESCLSDFHSTLVGCVSSLNGGYFFHIGDGAACALASDDYDGAVVSKAENGEYANETYFFTQDDWRDHLRITPFDSNKSLVLLMSDGVTPFALAPGGSLPFAGFVAPVTKILSAKTRIDGERALAQLLDDERIRKISGDDKTIVWALRVDRHVDG